VVSFTPQPLYPLGKSSRYPFDRRLGRPQSRSGKRGEEKILHLNRTRNLEFSRAISQVFMELVMSNVLKAVSVSIIRD
jgi:hypothetical protein